MADDQWVDDPVDNESQWVDDDHSQLVGSGPKHSQLRTAVEHLGQGATLGYMPQLQALTEKGIEGAGNVKDKLLDLVGLDSLASDDFQLEKQGFQLPKDRSYIEARDANIKRLADQAEENPWTAGVSNVAGGVASGIASTPLIASNLAPATTALGRLGQAAKTGVIYGGLANPGDVKGEVSPIQANKRVENAGLGGLTGLATQGAVETVSKAVPWAMKSAGEKLKSIAELKAARALGAERGTIKKIGMDRVKQAGRQALDEGIVTPLANTDDMIARNEAVKGKGGKLMGDVYEAIDSQNASTFNPLEVASKVEGEIGDFYRSPINRGETNQLENTLESILMRGEGNIPLREAQKLKQELGKVANWKNNLTVTDKERMARDAYGVVSSEIDNAVNKANSAVETAGLGDKLKQGKSLFSNSTVADQLLENRQAREQGNKLFGITDWGLMGGGLGAAVPTGGASIPVTMAMTAAKKFGEKYGNQTMAAGADKVSKMLLKSPVFQNLAEKSPRAFNALAADFARKMGQTSEVLGNVADGPDQQRLISEDESKNQFLEGN